MNITLLPSFASAEAGAIRGGISVAAVEEAVTAIFKSYSTGATPDNLHCHLTSAAQVGRDDSGDIVCAAELHAYGPAEKTLHEYFTPLICRLPQKNIRQNNIMFSAIVPAGECVFSLETIFGRHRHLAQAAIILHINPAQSVFPNFVPPTPEAEKTELNPHTVAAAAITLANACGIYPQYLPGLTGNAGAYILLQAILPRSPDNTVKFRFKLQMNAGTAEAESSLARLSEFAAQFPLAPRSITLPHKTVLALAGAEQCSEMQCHTAKDFCRATCTFELIVDCRTSIWAASDALPFAATPPPVSPVVMEQRLLQYLTKKMNSQITLNTLPPGKDGIAVTLTEFTAAEGEETVRRHTFSVAIQQRERATTLRLLGLLSAAFPPDNTLLCRSAECVSGRLAHAVDSGRATYRATGIIHILA